MLLALPLACGGSSESGEPCLVLPSLRAPDALQPSPTSSCGEPVFGAAALAQLDDLQAALFEQLCAQGVRCGVYPDVASCSQSRLAVSGSDPLRAAIEAGRTGVVPDATPALVDWFAPPEGCGRPTSSRVFESALQLIFPGSGAPGDACSVSTDCAGATRCDLSACDGEACCTGVCVEYRRGVGEGEPCVIDECGSGLSCYFIVSDTPEESDLVARCHPALRGGSECTGVSGENCEAGTSCRADPDGTLRCQLDPPELGEICGDASGSTNCGSLDVACRDGRVCEPRQPIGSACRTDDECLLMAACVDGECTLRLALGVACHPSADHCADGLDCNDQTGVCELPSFTVPTCDPASG